MNAFRLNLGLLFRTAVVLAGLGLLTHLVHAWQMKRHARDQFDLAQEAEQEGSTDQMAASLSRHLSFDPTSHQARIKYALILADRARSTRERWRALQVLRQAMPHADNQPEVRIRAAELALALDEPADAVRYLEPVIRQFPNRADLFEMIARCHLAAGQVAQAIQALERALKAAPDRVSSAVMLAGLLRQPQDLPRQADAVLDRLVQSNPRSAQAYLARARDRLTLGRYKTAGEDLAQARKLDPRNADVLRASAELAGLVGEKMQARDYWRQVLALAPEVPESYLNLARAEQDTDELPAAIRTLRKGQYRFPDNVDLLFALADALVANDDLQEAESWRKRLSAKTAPGRSAFLTGQIAQRQKRWLNAVRAYADALPTSDLSAEQRSRMMLALAHCYAHLGAHDEQFLTTWEAARLAPRPIARQEFAEMLVAAGRSEDALPILRWLVEKPETPARVWGLLARALVEYNRIRPAWQRDFRELDQALERASRDPDQAVRVALLRSDTLVMRNDLETAREILEQALEEHPRRPELYLALADLASSEGDTETVEAILTRANRRLGKQIDWLVARVERLARQRGPQATRALRDLEKEASDLAPDDRDRLQRVLASWHARLDNEAEVERLCRQILSRHPGDLRTRLLLVDALLARKDEKTVKQIIDDLRTFEGPEGNAWRCAVVALELSRARQGERGGLAEAGKRIEELRKSRPGWSQTALLAGELADLEGRHADALENYQRVLALGDIHPRALRRAVQLLSDRFRWTDANALLEQAQRRNVLSRDLLRPAAWIALRAGKNDRACELARLLVPPGSRDARDLIWLGRLLETAGRPTEANEAFSEAIEQAPQLPDPWLAQISFLVRQRRPAAARETFQRMEKELPDTRRALALAQASEILGQFADSERGYLDLLSSRPHDAAPLTRLANLYLRRNEPVKAHPILVRLLDPRVAVPEEDLPEIRRQLALVLTAPEFTADLVQPALELLAINRRLIGDTEADRRAEALVRARRPADRARSLRQLEALAGGPATVPEEQLRLAWLYDVTGDWPRARSQLQGLLAQDNDNTGYLAVLVDGLLRRGKKSEVASWLSRLERLDRDHPRIREFRDRLKKPAS